MINKGSRTPLLARLLPAIGIAYTPANVHLVMWLIIIIGVGLTVMNFIAAGSSGSQFGNRDEMLEKHPELFEYE